MFTNVCFAGVVIVEDERRCIYSMLFGEATNVLYICFVFKIIATFNSAFLYLWKYISGMMMIRNTAIVLAAKHIFERGSVFLEFYC